MNQIIAETITHQINNQAQLTHQKKKDNGIFFTNELKIIDSILDAIEFNNSVIGKKVLEPASGNGIFLLRIIERAYQHCPEKEKIRKFIENGLYFVDIDPVMIDTTKKNICALYENLFNEKYQGKFNGFVYDFTEKVKNNFSLFDEIKNKNLENLLGNIDYIVGNPPYVTLYGRRDRKKNEQQRINYLSQYKQFPQAVKNGKINYIMLFLENGLDFLKKDGKLSYIIDISFFETAYKYTRKYLLEKTKIIAIEDNISNFDGVASGQLIIKLQKNSENFNHNVIVRNFFGKETHRINQKDWYNKNDEYKFRLSFSDTTNDVLKKITKKAPQTLKNQYPKKALRTCAMLLNMEDKFINSEIVENKKCNYYKYYQGSKALYKKYCNLSSNKFFRYDKTLQNKINNELRIELTKKGIKNKKRIGLGDFLVYNNPKIFIRQSAKEIITSYDENLSAANNSLYVFSLRKDDEETREYLKFLCGYFNSELITFYAQKMEIIRYRKGKQPQIKISDLYSIPVPQDAVFIKKISKLVSQIYNSDRNKKELENKINQATYRFYNFSLEETEYIKKSIANFLKS
ncbi:MAG: Eco57I restriction-modification methylase domain-containing protein [Candidatus Nealsonbacteria bacterium]